MTGLNINGFVRDVGEYCKAHGFRERGFEPTYFISSIHGEVSELLEEFKNGSIPTETRYREGGKPEGIPPELADIVIWCCDMADYYGIDLEAAIIQKHEYNKSRPYKHGKVF